MENGRRSVRDGGGFSGEDTSGDVPFMVDSLQRLG